MGEGAEEIQTTAVVKNGEVPGTFVPVNEYVAGFVETNPSVAPYLSKRSRVHTGTLERPDRKDEEVKLQMKMLAGNISSILARGKNEDIKRRACESILKTVMSLQNPEYATELVVIRNEAYKIHMEFEDEKARKFMTGVASLEQLDAQPDPAEELMADFDAYLDQKYDMREMRREAALSLAPMVDRSVFREFVEVSDVAPEFEETIRQAFRRLGSFVSSRLVQVRPA